MTPALNRLDLRELGLRPGTRAERDFQLDIEPVRLGGVPFEIIVAEEGALVTVQRITGGHLVKVDLEAVAYGPCERCLEEVALAVSATEEEFVPSRPDEWEDADVSPFIQDQVVDVDGLAREALVLAMPAKILCEESCPGLCPECGAPAGSEACKCERDETDERWAGLADLDLGSGSDE
jgi:uncharacterized protein